MLVPIQAQELDAGSDYDSPAVPRQYELIGPTATYTAEHLYEKGDPGRGSHRKFLSLWQVNMARVLGRAGLVAALFVALGDRVSRMESRRLEIEPDGTMWASVAGPLQHVVAHVDNDETRARMRELASEGG